MSRRNYPEIILLEAPSSVLNSMSDTLDPQSGRRQTVLMAIANQAVAFGAFDVFSKYKWSPKPDRP